MPTRSSGLESSATFSNTRIGLFALLLAIWLNAIWFKCFLVFLSSVDKNSSEALFLKDNTKKENKTLPKHLKENILANIETNISASNNMEDVTYNHLEQIG